VAAFFPVLLAKLQRREHEDVRALMVLSVDGPNPGHDLVGQL
jgi:hypothetical protein